MSQVPERASGRPRRVIPRRGRSPRADRRWGRRESFPHQGSTGTPTRSHRRRSAPGPRDLRQRQYRRRSRLPNHQHSPGLRIQARSRCHWSPIPACLGRCRCLPSRSEGYGRRGSAWARFATAPRWRFRCRRIPTPIRRRRTRQAGRVLPTDGRRTRRRQSAKAASKVKCRFHDLRHSACTKLVERGVPLPVIASLLGWSAGTTVRMARRYGHISAEAQRSAVDHLEPEQLGARSGKEAEASPQ